MIDEFPSIISCLSRRVKIKVPELKPERGYLKLAPAHFKGAYRHIVCFMVPPILCKWKNSRPFIHCTFMLLVFFSVSSRRQTVYCCGTWPFEARCPSWHLRDPPGIEHRTSRLNAPSMPYLLLRNQFPSCANPVTISWVITVYLISCVNGNLGQFW